MPTWNHVWTDGDDINDLAILQMYEGAFIERNAGRGGVPITPAVVGDYIFKFGRWRSMQFDSTFGSNGTELWNGVWVTPWVESRSYTGEVDFSLGVIDWNYILTHALGGNGYTRKHPKEFATLASTVYNWTNTAIDPNAFVNGDYARCLADGLIYHRVAGAWVITANVFPDVQTSYGRMQVGDHFGAWILNEIRDAVNLLLAFTGSFSSPNGWIADGTANGIRSSVVTGSATWTGAQTACQVGPTTFSIDESPSASAAGGFDPFASQYFASFRRVKAKVQIQEFPDGLNGNVDCYTFGLTQATGFNNNGDPVTLGTLDKCLTMVTTGAGGTIKSDFVGSTTVPAWGPAPTGVGPGDVDVGYDVQITGPGNGATVVFRYDVVGGYTYRP